MHALLKAVLLFVIIFQVFEKLTLGTHNKTDSSIQGLFVKIKRVDEGIKFGITVVGFSIDARGLGICLTLDFLDRAVGL